jgi:anaerobic nitric oxide reductase transcription regulator
LALGGDLSAGKDDTQPHPQPSSITKPTGYTLREATKNFQRQVIKLALDRHGGNWAAAARELGTNRSNLHNLATRLNLRKKRPN